MPNEQRELGRIRPKGHIAFVLGSARAVIELVIANLRLRRTEAREWMGSGQDLAQCVESLSINQVAQIDRAAYFIPRVARRMPFRSDCLVQALAAQRWLARNCVATRTHFGTRKSAAKGFEAHAWLVAGTYTVTGWDIEDFEHFADFAPPRAVISG